VYNSCSQAEWELKIAFLTPPKKSVNTAPGGFRKADYSSNAASEQLSVEKQFKHFCNRVREIW
jgi:hypothetical protein